ncbi:MAG TPA: Uma2 family endonuclease [Thermoanaerobaculia bacterium]|jgi:Uma2 family endonuclease|nr:Uma2 family endonuclease [Thermoanaerobaculia bacterium]
MAVDSRPRLSPEEYLALERAAETKSDYLDGEMIAMTGASLRHNDIVTNLVLAIGNQLRGGSCRVYSSDLRVLVSVTGLYTYPDIVVVCGEPILTDKHFDTLTNPTVLIEVLSPSTAAYDRGTKLEHYRSLESLRECLFVSQDQPKVEQYIRQEDRKKWLLTEVTELTASVVMPSIGCQVAMSEIYVGS